MTANHRGGRRASVLIGALALVFSLAATGWAQGAPDFTLTDVVNGKQYSLSQFRGKVVLLNFFAFFCQPCREEMPWLNQLDREFKAQGFQTLGIGLASEPAQLRQLAEQLGISYPVLAGTEEVRVAYGKIDFVPVTFVIDRQGNIVHKVFEERSKEDFIKLIKPLL